MIGKGKDYYKILGVDSQASQDAIEKAYKGKFAEMGLRPENVKNPVQVKKFEEVREAYMTLRNPDRRISYNRTYQQGMDIKEAQDVFESFFHTNGIEGEMEKEFFKEHFPHIKVSPYEVLQIPATSTFEETQKAYRTLVLKAHPIAAKHDPEAEKKFIQITEAYRELVEREKVAKLQEQKREKDKDMNKAAQVLLKGIVKKLSKVIGKTDGEEKPSKKDTKLAKRDSEKRQDKNSRQRIEKNRKRDTLRSSSKSSDRDRNRSKSTSSVSSRDQRKYSSKRGAKISHDGEDIQSLSSVSEERRKVDNPTRTRKTKQISESSFEKIESKDLCRRTNKMDRKDSTSSLSSRERVPRGRRDRKSSTSLVSSEDKQRRQVYNKRNRNKDAELMPCLRKQVACKNKSSSSKRSKRQENYRQSSSRSNYREAERGQPSRRQRRRVYRHNSGSTSQMSSEERGRDRRCKLPRRYQAKEPSLSSSDHQRRGSGYRRCEDRQERYSRKGKQCLRQEYRNRKDSTSNIQSSEYSSVERGPRNRRIENRKQRKDRKESTSEFTSQASSRSRSFNRGSSNSRSRSNDRNVHGRDAHRTNANQQKNSRCQRDRQGRNRNTNKYDENQNRSRKSSRVEKVYTSDKKWHADSLEKGSYGVAKENSPKQTANKHLKETGLNASAQAHDNPQQKQTSNLHPKQAQNPQPKQTINSTQKTAQSKPHAVVVPPPSIKKPDPPGHINKPVTATEPKPNIVKTQTATLPNTTLPVIEPSHKKEPTATGNPKVTVSSPVSQVATTHPTADAVPLHPAKTEQPTAPIKPKETDPKVEPKQKKSDDDKPELLKPNDK